MNYYAVKKRHRAKRERDQKKKNEKLLKSVDGYVMTKHAADRANERGVSKVDIKEALKNGKVRQTSAKTYRVNGNDVAVIIARVPTKRLEEGTPSHVAVVTTWKGRTWKGGTDYKKKKLKKKLKKELKKKVLTAK